jgi:short-subunit dehydrogenase
LLLALVASAVHSTISGRQFGFTQPDNKDAARIGRTMMIRLQGAVVVITGASSGIGRATALAFAEAGASVVLAARRELALRELAELVTHRGGTALVVPTDVTDESQVDHLAIQAKEAFGRIDIWVNNAAVTLLGDFNGTPLNDYKRVIETNFFGTVHGARAALAIFKEQGSGTLINLSSVVSRMPQPYASAYVASKRAIRALGMSLRQELILQGEKNIHVITIMPATIDTPLFQHAANYSGRTVQPPPPVNPASMVAEVIVKAAINPRREIFVGRGARFIATQMELFPGITERLTARMIDKTHLGDTPAKETTGNLYHASADDGAVSGGWGSLPPPSWTNKLVAGIAVAFPAWGIWWLRRHSHS